MPAVTKRDLRRQRTTVATVVFLVVSLFIVYWAQLDADLERTYMEGDPERVIMDYLNLCAEEYFWYTRGRIDTEIWRAWRNGMENWLQVPAIRTVAVRESKLRDSYYGLFDEVRVG